MHGSHPTPLRLSTFPVHYHIRTGSRIQVGTVKQVSRQLMCRLPLVWQNADHVVEKVPQSRGAVSMAMGAVFHAHHSPFPGVYVGHHLWSPRRWARGVDHLQYDNAEGPDVRLVPVLLGQRLRGGVGIHDVQYLRGGVVEVGRRDRIVRSGEAEIGEHVTNFLRCRDAKDVGRPDVAVDHVVVLKVLQCSDHVGSHLEYMIRTLATLLGNWRARDIWPD